MSAALAMQCTDARLIAVPTWRKANRLGDGEPEGTGVGSATALEDAWRSPPSRAEKIFHQPAWHSHDIDPSHAFTSPRERQFGTIYADAYHSWTHAKLVALSTLLDLAHPRLRIFRLSTRCLDGMTAELSNDEG